jgi:hypothetical protein
MLVSRRIAVALGAACLTLFTVVSMAAAAEPSTVTVRVEGANGATLLPQTQVTTTTAPIQLEGGTCSGTSVGGALFDAVHGNWHVKVEGLGVSILGIEGQDFPPFGPEDYVFWSIWKNGTFAEGTCDEGAAQVAPNDHLVFFAQCFATGPFCPSATTPDHFLTMTAPSSSVVGVGEPVSVTVGSLSTSEASPEALPAGVSVSGGPVSSVPGSNGSTALTFNGPGTYTLQAHAPDSVPSEPVNVCVHNGNDGTCGTTGSSSSSSGSSASSGVAGVKTVVNPYTGPFALVAQLAGLANGRVYSRSGAPRLLQGTVLAHSAVTAVDLELRRDYKGRCWTYEGVREKFVHARCGTGRLFKVSSAASFSYLLPSRLAPGRYVLDVHANDAAGNRTALARGSSRIVFDVR